MTDPLIFRHEIACYGDDWVCEECEATAPAQHYIPSRPSGQRYEEVPEPDPFPHEPDCSGYRGEGFEERLSNGLLALAVIQARGSHNPEVDHSDADDILLEIIGSDDVRRAFQAIKKWYA